MICCLFSSLLFSIGCNQPMLDGPAMLEILSLNQLNA